MRYSDIDIEDKRDSLYFDAVENQEQINGYEYRKAMPEIAFSASGINPFRAAVRKVKKLTGGPKLIFIWPQKSSHYGRVKSFVVPVVRGLLYGLVVLDMLHLWPGEFMPNSLPSTLPPPLRPVKCNVIEPLWSENS
ncbi:uncharacterized protein LOC111642843 [Copidosoma floridanum]|uniref:uncharacterized protein LOC111642843 n=1 Tax=Copidosoma floridanum TaxID=29053 RepID=UPI000C6F6C33|nr:uncharacterized protein LOC111642843 [Copidosoma floridanum]